MWFMAMLLVLSLSLLGLGAAQECEGFVGVLGMTPDQLKKEIRANVEAALKQGAVMNTGNGTCVGPNQEEQNTTLVEKIVDTAIERHLATAVEEVIANISNSFEQLLSPIMIAMNKSNANIQAMMAQLHLLRLPGSTPSHPAASCKEIKELSTTAPSGYYWLRGTGDSSVHMYCDMSRSCGGITGGWMPVAKINMTNSNHTCPAGLKLLTTPKRLCTRVTDVVGCSSATFNLHGIRYTHVCGKIVAYQQGTPDAFGPYYYSRHLTIDDNYMDGISLTHGRNPRKHIWTFAAALEEVTTSYPNGLCPCTNVHNTVTMWAVTTSVTLPVKPSPRSSSIPMILSGMVRAVVD